MKKTLSFILYTLLFSVALTLADPVCGGSPIKQCLRVCRHRRQTPAYGQGVSVSAKERQQVMQKFNAASSSLKSMQCDFVQTKKMKLLKNEMHSKGIMYFVSPNKLRWQYNTPYSYVFILNGNEVQIKSETSTKKIDTQRNKMFRQLSSVILQSITGGHLRNSSDFTIDILKTNNVYSARLTPKKKELQRLYNAIDITFNKNLTMVKSVRMEEKTGDITTVEILNVKTNTPISETLFKVH